MTAACRLHAAALSDKTVRHPIRLQTLRFQSPCPSHLSTNCQSSPINRRTVVEILRLVSSWWILSTASRCSTAAWH